MTVEKTLESLMPEDIKARQGVAIKFPAAFISGFVDRIVLMPGGRIYFVELKSTGKKPANLQKWWHRRLRWLGFIVFVIDNRTDYNNFLKLIDEIPAT